MREQLIEHITIIRWYQKLSKHKITYVQQELKGYYAESIGDERFDGWRKEYNEILSRREDQEKNDPTTARENEEGYKNILIGLCCERERIQGEILKEQEEKEEKERLEKEKRKRKDTSPGKGKSPKRNKLYHLSSLPSPPTGGATDIFRARLQILSNTEHYVTGHNVTTKFIDALPFEVMAEGNVEGYRTHSLPRREWKRIDPARKSQMLANRAAHVHETVWTEAKHSGLTEVDTMENLLRDRAHLSDPTKINRVFLPTIDAEERSLRAAFLFTPSHFNEEMLYVQCFEYGCHILMYVQGELEKRTKLLSPARKDLTFYKNIPKLVSGLTNFIIWVFRDGPDVSINKAIIPLKHINSESDIYWQYFAAPFLRFAKRLFGRHISMQFCWDTDTPAKFRNRMNDSLRKGICSFTILDAHYIWPKAHMDDSILSKCFFPIVRAMQMLHSSFYHRQYDMKDQPDSFWMKMTPDELKLLEDKAPITYRHRELGEVTLEPLPKPNTRANEPADLSKANEKEFSQSRSLFDPAGVRDQADY
jgi:hypothetical protein